jgi:acetyl-CoA synthetase
MVQHNYAYPLAHIVTAKYWQNVIDGGLHFTVADTGWAKSVWGKIYGQWICGSAVFVYDYEAFNAAGLLEKASKCGVTTFCAPPTVYRLLIKEDLSHYDLACIKHCVVAGEPLNGEVYERFLSNTGLKLMEGYGQTETTVTIATFPWMEPKPGSMGRPSPAYKIQLRNAEGKLCETGEEGEIVIDVRDGKPLGLFSGYYRDEETTRGVWHDGYYYTGDLAWMDEDGYLWFVGRSDDVIKSSGYRIGPFEVESALIQHPSVLECAITAVPDPVRGQAVKATIVLAKGFTASDELKLELQNHVKTVTAPYKYPRVIEFVEQLPKTISGKIRRVEIRDKDHGRQEETQE